MRVCCDRAHRCTPGRGKDNGDSNLLYFLGKTSNGLDAKKCSKCATAFGRDKKYRVSVSVRGKGRTRVVDNLTIAREVEAALKGDLVRDEFEIADHRAGKAGHPGGRVDKYLPWAKEKRNPGVTMNTITESTSNRDSVHGHGNITGFDIEKMKTELKKGLSAHDKPYAAPTIKHRSSSSDVFSTLPGSGTSMTARTRLTLFQCRRSTIRKRKCSPTRKR